MATGGKETLGNVANPIALVTGAAIGVRIKGEEPNPLDILTVEQGCDTRSPSDASR
jgi:hypothetical protein